MINNNPTNIFVNSSFALIIMGEFFMFQIRDNKPNIWYPNMLGLFGGKIEKNENEKEAIIREINEETNLKIKKFKLLNSQTVHLNGKKYSRYVFFTKINYLPKNFSINEGRGYKLLKKEDIAKLKKNIVPTDYISVSNFLRIYNGCYLS